MRTSPFFPLFPTSYFLLPFFISALWVCLSAPAFAWVGPSVPPPDSNAQLPLNASSDSQEKLGGLGLGSGLGPNKFGLWVENGYSYFGPGLGSFDSTTAAADNANYALTVDGNLRAIDRTNPGMGKVYATAFCIADDTDCITSWTGAGGGATLGQGNLNYLARWTSNSTVGASSILQDLGSNITLTKVTPNSAPLLFINQSSNTSNPSVGAALYVRNDNPSVDAIDAIGNTKLTGDATTTGNLEVVGTASTSKLCIGTDCRSAWPIGASGSTWYSGSGAPISPPSFGIIGDYYLDTSVGDVYKKVSYDSLSLLRGWSFLLNIKGADGSRGPSGTNGSTWYSYSGNGAPVSTSGVNGDYSLNTATSDVYKKVSGSWSFLLNIKGADGSRGPSGVVSATPPLALSSANISLSTPASGCTAGQVLGYDGSNWVCQFSGGKSVTISGSQNYLPKILNATAPATFSQSLIYDDGTNISVNNSAGNPYVIFDGQGFNLNGNLSAMGTNDYFSGQVTIDTSIGGSLCLGVGACRKSWPKDNGGTVTSISTGTGLTTSLSGGPITTSGTISIAKGGITDEQISNLAAINPTKLLRPYKNGGQYFLDGLGQWQIPPTGITSVSADQKTIFGNGTSIPLNVGNIGAEKITSGTLPISVMPSIACPSGQFLNGINGTSVGQHCSQPSQSVGAITSWGMLIMQNHLGYDLTLNVLNDNLFNVDYVLVSSIHGSVPYEKPYVLQGQVILNQGQGISPNTICGPYQYHTTGVTPNSYFGTSANNGATSYYVSFECIKLG